MGDVASDAWLFDGSDIPLALQPAALDSLVYPFHLSEQSLCEFSVEGVYVVEDVVKVCHFYVSPPFYSSSSSLKI